MPIDNVMLLIFIFLVLYGCENNTEDPKISGRDYIINETGLTGFYNDRTAIAEPGTGEAYYGQDAHYPGNQFSFRDNGDGTVSDLNTGLMWQKSNFRLAFTSYGDYRTRMKIFLDSINSLGLLGGHDDWRVPTVKEQLSIADFSGNVKEWVPYIDTDVFDFIFPSENINTFDPPGTRKIDAQHISANKYAGIVNNREEGFIAFNYADGHIKTYRYHGRQTDENGYYLKLVRGNQDYGVNRFHDNADGTVSDLATGLMWQKRDDGVARDWAGALSYAENLELAGHTDWYLPDVKELQSIVDYSRNNPALNTAFLEMSDPEGWFWSSTTYLGITNRLGIYIAFGKAVNYRGVDTHGAGALRGDFKSGDPGDWPQGLGPQSDEVRIHNYVRAVRRID
jgi:hypothetical protein